MANYDEASVVRYLNNNPAIRVNSIGKVKTVEIVKDSTILGNGTWGRIDFLTKYCGYIQSIVSPSEQQAAKLAERKARNSSKHKVKEDSKSNIIKKVTSKLNRIKFNK